MNLRIFLARALIELAVSDNPAKFNPGAIGCMVIPNSDISGSPTKAELDMIVAKKWVNTPGDRTINYVNYSIIKVYTDVAKGDVFSTKPFQIDIGGGLITYNLVQKLEDENTVILSFASEKPNAAVHVLNRLIKKVKQ